MIYGSPLYISCRLWYFIFIIAFRLCQHYPIMHSTEINSPFFCSKRKFNHAENSDPTQEINPQGTNTSLSDSFQNLKQRSLGNQFFTTSRVVICSFVCASFAESTMHMSHATLPHIIFIMSCFIRWKLFLISVRDFNFNIAAIHRIFIVFWSRAFHPSEFYRSTTTCSERWRVL